MNRTQAVDHAGVYVDRGTLQADLGALSVTRSESQNPAQAFGRHQSLSRAIRARLEAMSFKCALRDDYEQNDPAHGGPFL